MFKKRQQAQPKEAYEQPEINEEDREQELDDSYPIALDEELQGRLDGRPLRPKANPSIIGKYYR
jgi:hypothetical protein